MPLRLLKFCLQDGEWAALQFRCRSPDKYSSRARIYIQIRNLGRVDYDLASRESTRSPTGNTYHLASEG
ncbi:uncharacterized protein BDCG_16679 [Blastomyces dermatitidis ER-3]|uniref:Uncharacterized protein n=1 Tax=Ajellomyces dermatitidis (strain ER-3 / ATCC MYA-2586) TaxID=559297 RepID=A0ABX2VTP8_AJEDR|nr:uncharacterized protein BDCG_16679 [Blastomyces dermatitidis ER-3]OAT00560.1 hypothetical protein BDCG_16679 [Blastomyces dermatitidis ER-3]